MISSSSCIVNIHRIASIALLAASVPTGWLSAQDATSAKAFLASIYRHYESGGDGIDIGDQRANQYFAHSLLALVRADARAAGPGNVGAIDADPVCACQDWDGIWQLNIDVKMKPPGKAEADVSFSLSSPQSHTTSASRRLHIKLISEHGGWRIDDIIDLTDPKIPYALRKALLDDIELNRRKTQTTR